MNLVNPTGNSISANNHIFSLVGHHYVLFSIVPLG